MKWTDLDLTSKTKTGRSHTLPLPEVTISILNEIPRDEGYPHVFPSHGKTAHLVESKKPWQRIEEKAGLLDIRIHDLRRTVGSWLAAQGESLTMIGKVLNHSQPSTTAIYARLDTNPVRKALDKNAEQMMLVIKEAQPEEDK